MFAVPLLTIGGVTPALDGRTPVFIEHGADPRVSPGFDAPIGSILRFGANYFSKTDTAATAWELIGLGAGAGANYWLQQQQAFAARFLGPSSNKWAWFSDFLRAVADDFNVNVLGTATFAIVQALDTSRGGQARYSSGANANSSATVQEKTATPILGGRPTEKWAYCWRGKVNTAIDANTIMEWQLETVTAVLQLSFGVRGSVSTAAWYCEAGGSSTTGGTIDQNVHTFMAANDGTNVHFFVDGTEIASRSSAGMANIAIRMRGVFNNGATAAVREFNIDKIAILGNDVTV